MRFLGLFITFLAAVIIMACSHNEDEKALAVKNDFTASELLDDTRIENIWENCLDSAPDGGCVRLQLRWIGPLRKEFNDSNHTHLAAARQLGFTPIKTSVDILNINRPIVRVESCQDFFVEPPTHSFPYLVAEASDLLHEIGQRFNDSLQARGGGSYRIKVTSLLRTPATVKRLSRVNRNATSESTHTYGTTFDISYSKFICDNENDTHRTFEDLKNLLGEILHDMRNENRCYVKYEVKQSCFHITVRPKT